MADYYIHNIGNQNKKTASQWKYPITYMGYLIEAGVKYLEVK
jgi:hypothetical protein